MQAPRLEPVAKTGLLERLLARDYVVRLLSVVSGLLLWELIGSHYPYSMSSPWGVVRAINKYLSPQVLPAGLQTLRTFSLGFAICIVAGIPIGLAMARIKFFRIALEPYVMTLNSMPMLAIFPLLIIGFGIGIQLRVVATVLFGIFPVIVNTLVGASRVDFNLEDVGRSFVASGWKRLTTFIFPGSLDYIFTGVRVGFGHAMIGTIVIELEASMVGFGSLLQQYSQYLELGAFFLVVMILGTFSILFSICLRRFQRWATKPWERSHRLVERRERTSATRVARGGSPYCTVSNFKEWCVSAVRAVSRALGPLWSLLGGPYRVVAACGRFLTGRVTAWILRAAILAGIILLWQRLSLSESQAVMPAPRAFVKAFYKLSFQTGAVWGPLGTSLILFFSGFLASVVIGIPIGLLMGRFRLVALALDPYVSFLYGLPIVVFVPIFVIWLGFGFNFGLAFVIVSAVWVVIINTMQGVLSVSPDLIDAGRSFCATERKIMRTIVIPSTVPFVIAGARLAFSVSWIGVIVSEVISSETGLGGMISSYATAFLQADMVVPITYIAVISVVLLTMANEFAPRLTPWAIVKQ